MKPQKTKPADSSKRDVWIWASLFFFVLFIAMVITSFQFEYKYNHLKESLNLIYQSGYLNATQDFNRNLTAIVNTTNIDYLGKYQYIPLTNIDSFGIERKYACYNIVEVKE